MIKEDVKEDVQYASSKHKTCAEAVWNIAKAVYKRRITLGLEGVLYNMSDVDVERLPPSLDNLMKLVTGMANRIVQKIEQYGTGWEIALDDGDSLYTKLQRHKKVLVEGRCASFLDFLDRVFLLDEIPSLDRFVQVSRSYLDAIQSETKRLEALWEQEKRRIREKMDQEERGKYLYYNYFVLRTPSASKLGINADNLSLLPKGGWANDRILDIFKMPENVSKKVKKIGPENIRMIDRRLVEVLLSESESMKTEIVPIAFYNFSKKGRELDGFVVLANSEEKMAFLADINCFSYFETTYSRCRFFASEKRPDLIRVCSLGEAVGLLATTHLCLPYGNTQEDILRRALAVLN